MTFIIENLSTILVSVAVVGVLLWAGISIVKDKRSGKCCSGCANCQQKDDCIKK